MVEINVEIIIDASIEKVWKFYTNAEHIKQWNNASDDWHTPRAENDLRVGGKFVYRMEAKDSSVGFDLEGEYTEIEENEIINYTMNDGRKVRITFSNEEGKTLVSIMFDAETENSIEMQKEGWQAILNNFKRYIESN